jgi:hypothetical protein
MDNIPEEIHTMAWLMGQSKAIDSNIIEKNTGLSTDGNTIKHQLDEYIKVSRGIDQVPRAAVQHAGHSFPQPAANPPVFTRPPVSPPPLELDQLEFNLNPNKADLIISILKEISVKLTKQNNILQSLDETFKNKEKGIPVLTKKSS